MTITETIKFIISQTDDSLLIDVKRFMSYLRDYSPEYSKELNILRNGINANVLRLFFIDNRPQKNKIALVKMALEDQGLSEKWIDFIVDSFCSALNWQIKNNDVKVVEDDFVNNKVDISEAKKRFDELTLKIKNLEKKNYKVQKKVNSFRLDIEGIEKIKKDWLSKYDSTNADFLEAEKEYQKAKDKYESLKNDRKSILDYLREIQIKSENMYKKYEESKKNSIESMSLLAKLKLEADILKADYGDMLTPHDIITHSLSPSTDSIVRKDDDWRDEDW